MQILKKNLYKFTFILCLGFVVVPIIAFWNKHCRRVKVVEVKAVSWEKLSFWLFYCGHKGACLLYCFCLVFFYTKIFDNYFNANQRIHHSYIQIHNAMICIFVILTFNSQICLLPFSYRCFYGFDCHQVEDKIKYLQTILLCFFLFFFCSYTLNLGHHQQ